MRRFSHTMSVDIETYSAQELKDVGVYRYAEDESFEVLLIAYKIDDNDTRITDLAMGDTPPEEFMQMLYSEDCLKTAFNANFERTCLAQAFGRPVPPEQWQCTMVRSAMLGLPMSLDAVGAALHLSEDEAKMKAGKALIRYFCKPCKPTKANDGRTRNLPAHDPDKWELFKQYCMRDVDAEHKILEILDGFGGMPESEAELWCMDQKINDAGVMLDRELIERIIEYDDRRTAELKAEAKALTGLDNPNSLTQLKKWIAEQGVEFEGLTKAHVEELLKGDLPDSVRRMLQIRQALGKTSTAKYKKMQEAVCEDSRLRGCLQFYGAGRTGRWAGRLVQVHNLPQNHIDDIFLCRELVDTGDTDSATLCWGESAYIFSQLIRTAFIPDDGLFVVSDFSAIEARVLAWLAGEEWRMDVFRDGGDIYCASASRMFGVPVEKHGVNGHLRQKGKVAELALGYQGGVGAMKRMDSSGAIPEEEMPKIVADWRNASPHITKLWRDIESAAKAAIVEGRPESRPASILKGRIKFYMDRGVMFMVLPSGRKLAYWDAHVTRAADGRDHIIFTAMNQETHKWSDTETYGGKLVENAVQAIARDCLAEAMQRVDKAGYRIVMHVHDEMIIEAKGATETEAEKMLDTINELMAVSPEWASDLVLRGDGYVTPFYRKD